MGPNCSLSSKSATSSALISAGKNPMCPSSVMKIGIENIYEGNRETVEKRSKKSFSHSKGSSGTSPIIRKGKEVNNQYNILNFMNP